MKYPFWVLKSDGLRLLKGKWNPLVLALFIPFLIYCGYIVRFFMTVEKITDGNVLQSYLLWFDIITLAFSVISEVIALGIYYNLLETKETASFFGTYAFGFRHFFKLLPSLCLSVVLPTGLGMLLSYGNLDWFYDYLLFSLMSYQVYYLLIAVLSLGLQILGIYLQYSLLLAPCILADHPDYNGFRVVRESFQLSRGKRGYLFLMGINFIGWFFLGSLAVIGILWAMLYFMATRYAYYRRLTRPQDVVIDLNPPVI